MSTLIHGDIIRHFPRFIIEAIDRVAKRQNVPVFLVGGIVRDYFLARHSHDLDLVIPSDSDAFCHELIAELGGGAFVSLAGKKGEDTARVVFADVTVDVSGYRGQAQSLDQDLLLRDFTVNGLAADFCLIVRKQQAPLVDPAGGMGDLERRQLKLFGGAVDDDPLRMLRGFRLQATLGFTLNDDAREEITRKRETIHQVSWERKMVELQNILETDDGAKEFREMAACGLLQELFPDLGVCQGVEQPDFHHLDVFNHCLETLSCMEQVIAEPAKFFSGYIEEIEDYLSEEKIRVRLKWAALFHDLGKPSTKAEHEQEKGRVTFHQHDFIGSRMVGEMAGTIRLSRDDTKMIVDLINQHMHPFHLSNLYREDRLSTKAVVRLAKKAGAHLIGLFLLAMSDSLASHGRLKPQTMEQEIDGLFQQVYSQYISLIMPVQKSERFLDGNDLIKQFALEPGPDFKQILDELELAVIEKKVKNRTEAMSWVSQYIKSDKCV